MRLEPEFWDALGEICRREQKDLASLIQNIEATSPPAGRTSAVRTFILSYFRSAASEDPPRRGGGSGKR